MNYFSCDVLQLHPKIFKKNFEKVLNQNLGYEVFLKRINLINCCISIAILTTKQSFYPADKLQKYKSLAANPLASPESDGSQRLRKKMAIAFLNWDRELELTYLLAFWYEFRSFRDKIDRHWILDNVIAKVPLDCFTSMGMSCWQPIPCVRYGVRESVQLHWEFGMP